MSSDTSTTFDPNTQTITILMADGVTPVYVSLTDVDASNWFNIASSINFGAQMGACFVMFFVVLVLTKSSKRRTAVFILNLLSLLFGFLRALLYVLYFPSPWCKTYSTFTGDVQFIPRTAYATSVAGSVMPLLLTITVNLSLLLQAYTVCKNMSNIHRHIITLLSVVVILLAVGFRFAVTVTNAETILNADLYYTEEWIKMGSLVTETIAIWYFSIIFTGKLVYTLYDRRRRGWKQWSGVKILAAMGGCTMIIPSIFAILEYVEVANFPAAGSLAVTMVVLLLPLSSLWAGMAIDEEVATLNFSHLAGTASTGPIRKGSDQNKICGSGSQFSDSTFQSGRNDYTFERKGSHQPPISPSTIDSRIEGGKTTDSTDIDLEGRGVRVDKSFNLQSRQGSLD